MTTLKIDVEKIRDVIGQGGKVIQKICAECNVKIDIEEDLSLIHIFLPTENMRNARCCVLMRLLRPKL